MGLGKVAGRPPQLRYDGDRKRLSLCGDSLFLKVYSFSVSRHWKQPSTVLPYCSLRKSLPVIF